MSVYQPRSRDPFTQQVSLKIGATLEKYFMQLHAESGYPLNTIYRDALTRFAEDPASESYLQEQNRARQNEQRILELEEQLRRLKNDREPVKLPVSLPMAAETPESEEEIQAAFRDDNVMLAVVHLAQLIQTGDIDLRQQAITEHFDELCPEVKVKRIRLAIAEIGYRVEHQLVDYQAAGILQLFLSFHPETADATGAA